MDVESSLLGFPGKNPQLLRQNLLLLESHLLVPEKHDTAIRDDDGKFANQFIGVRSMNEMAQIQVRVLATDSGSNLEVVIVVETSSGLEGFATKFGRRNHGLVLSAI